MPVDDPDAYYVSWRAVVDAGLTRADVEQHVARVMTQLSANDDLRCPTHSYDPRVGRVTFGMHVVASYAVGALQRARFGLGHALRAAAADVALRLERVPYLVKPIRR